DVGGAADDACTTCLEPKNVRLEYAVVYKAI
ncbi:MAG: hypothetical protein ACI9XU_001476, partial [Arenicella sp.]